MDKKKTDIQAHDALIAASDALGIDEDYETLQARTAIACARASLMQLQMALLILIDGPSPYAEDDEPHC